MVGIAKIEAVLSLQDGETLKTKETPMFGENNSIAVAGCRMTRPIGDGLVALLTKWLLRMVVCSCFVFAGAANAAETKVLPIKNKSPAGAPDCDSVTLQKNNGDMTITPPAGAKVVKEPAAGATGEVKITGLAIPPGGTKNITFDNPNGSVNYTITGYDYLDADGKEIEAGKCGDPIGIHVRPGGPGGDNYLGYPIPSGHYGYFYQMFSNSMDNTTVLKAHINLGTGSGAYNFQVLNNTFRHTSDPGFDLEDIEVPLRNPPDGAVYEVVVPFMDSADATGNPGIPTGWSYNSVTGVATMDFTGAGGLAMGQTGSIVAFASPYPPTVTPANMVVDYQGGFIPPCTESFASDAFVPSSPTPPELVFQALPELPGAPTQASVVDDVCDIKIPGMFAVGRSLDGDGMWKAVVWEKDGIDDWQIQTLPNPFGNTESASFVVEAWALEGPFTYSMAAGSASTLNRVCIGGLNDGNPCTSNAQCPDGICPPAPPAALRPVVWSTDGVEPWAAEVLPLPPAATGGEVKFLALPDIQDACYALSAAGTGQLAGISKAVLWQREEGCAPWTVEFLPDHGPGFYSEATCIVHDNIFIDDVHIGGASATPSSPMAPCVWQSLPAGGTERVDLPMTPGAYLGSLKAMEYDAEQNLILAVGHNASVAGLADLYRGVLYRREDGDWSAPLELPPLPSMRDSRATGVAFGTANDPEGITVVGYSYIELSSGSERATLWEVAIDNTIVTYDLGDQTLNLPPGVTLLAGSSVYARDLPDAVYNIAGNFSDLDSPSTLHAYVLSGPPAADPFETIDPTQVVFGSSDVPPVPPGFFAPGSQPFFGSVYFQGGGSDPEDSAISARVQRLTSAACPGFDIPRPCEPIPMQIASLDLVSIDPITVDGPNPTSWNVHMGLSQFAAPLGGMGLNLEHANGGTYGSFLPIIPQLTFTNVNNPGDVRVLDFGEAGYSPIHLVFNNVPWVATLDSQLAEDVVAPSDGNFVPLVQEQMARGPGVQTAVSVTGTSVGGGFTHSIGPAKRRPRTPLADPSGLPKTRFISFSVPGANGSVGALRVTLVSLHHVNPPYAGGPSIPFTSFEGQVRWVGPPAQYVESFSTGIPFQAARLQCTPHYQNWTNVGLLHVTGSAIVPSSIYEVENLAASCMGHEATCTRVSAPLAVVTTRWGDVQAPYNPPSPTIQPDIGDVSALVSKFRSAPGAPIKARAFLTGADVFGNIPTNMLDLDFSFTHISACVDAFRGSPYPYAIQACP